MCARDRESERVRECVSETVMSGRKRECVSGRERERERM